MATLPSTSVDPLQCSHTDIEYTGDSLRGNGVRWTHWDCKQCNSIVWLNDQNKVVRLLPPNGPSIEPRDLPPLKEQK